MFALPFVFVQILASSPPVAELTTDALGNASVLVDRWTVEDGLPIQHVSDVAQDRHGYIWVATFDGLSRFDGRRWHTFRKADTPGLQTNRISEVELDPYGRLLVLTEPGAVLDFADGHSHTWAEAALGGPVRSFDRIGDALYALGHRGLSRIDPSGPTRIGEGVIKGEVAGLVAAGDALIAAEIGGAIFRIDNTVVVPLWTPTERIESLASDGQHVYATSISSVLKLNLAERTVEPLLGDGGAPWQGAPCNLTGGDRVKVVAKGRWYEVQGGRLVARGSGKCHSEVLSVEGHSWWSEGGTLWHDGSAVTELATEVRRMTRDDAGNLWAASDEGVFRIRPRPVKVLSNGNIGSVLSMNGTLWVARWRGPTIPVDGPGAPIEPGPDNSRGGGSWSDSLSLLSRPAGVLWIGTHAGVCEVRDSRCVALSGQPEIPETRNVRAMMNLTSETVLSGADGGLFRIARRGQGWHFEAWQPAGVPMPRARSFLERDRGALLVSTTGHGLFEIIGESVRSIRGLGSLGPRSLTRGRAGTWIGTDDGGICLLRPESVEAACITSAHGLLHDAIHVAVEHGDRLWLSSNRGLILLDLSQALGVLTGTEPRVTPIQLDDDDGMVNRECNGQLQPAWSWHEGRLSFPTQGGVALIDPALMVPQPPTVTIDGIDLAGTRMPPSVVHLSPDSGRLLVNWNAPALRHGEDLRFRHRLRGQDETWSPASTETRREWSGLAPGDYVFEVQAGLGGRWGPIATLPIVRAPAFVETSLFPVMLVLSALLLAGAGWSLRVRQVRARETYLSQQVGLRTTELEAANEHLASQANTLEATNERLRGLTGLLEQISQQKSRFIAAISHELRTPLTLILGPLEDALANRQGSTENLAVALRNAQHLQGLVEELLRLARLDATAGQLAARRASLASCVALTCERFSDGAIRRGLRLSVELEASPTLYFDPELIDRAVGNLVGNALKWTSEGGQIRVRVSATADWAIIEVVDTGVGIAETEQGAIFERFYQVAGANEGGSPGTGLGLALVREVVELHGGSVTVASALGAGSTFRVRLPLGVHHLSPDDIHLGDRLRAGLSTPPPESEGGPEDMEPDERPRLLIVEDHPDLRDYLAAHFAADWQVATAKNGRDALDKLRLERPAVVVSDVVMPEMNGIELCRRLREDPALADLPVVLVSARSAEDVADEVRGLASDFVGKPFRVPELLERVRAASGLPDDAFKRVPLNDRTSEEDPSDDPSEDVPAIPPGQLTAADVRLLERLDRIARGHLPDEDFGVAEWAIRAAMSRRTLARRFKELTGRTASDHLRELRLSIARSALEAGEAHTIAEIAHSVGLSPAYFTRLFSAQYGYSPSRMKGHGRTGSG